MGLAAARSAMPVTPASALTPARQPHVRDGTAPGERVYLQRGRLKPRTPALRISHSPVEAHEQESRPRTPPNKLTNKWDSMWSVLRVRVQFAGGYRTVVLRGTNG